MSLTQAEIQKIETGVRVLRDSLEPFGLGVELVCRARQKLPNGNLVPFACNVVEPYGLVVEADCPIHDCAPED